MAWSIFPFRRPEPAPKPPDEPHMAAGVYPLEHVTLQVYNTGRRPAELRCLIGGTSEYAGQHLVIGLTGLAWVDPR